MSDPKSPTPPNAPNTAAPSARVAYKARRGMLTQAGAPVAEVLAVRERQRSLTTVDGGIVSSMAAIATKYEQEQARERPSSNDAPVTPEPETVIFARFDPHAVVEDTREALIHAVEPTSTRGPRYNRKVLFVILGALSLAEVAAAIYVAKAIRTSISNCLR